jgi:hypothetical protein
MEAYTRGDCRSAEKLLAQVPSQDDHALAAAFYAGACEMKLGDRSAATSRLQQVADAGDSPQQEAAFYYLAQLSLSGGDSAAAGRYLGRTIALRGDFEQRARIELEKLH